MMFKLPIQRNPYPAVDAVIIKADKVLLVRRKRPMKNVWALPGGFVEWGETVEEAVIREVKEETGLNIELEDILGVYSSPDRDPRGHIITIVFIGKPRASKLKISEENIEAKWFSVKELRLIKFYSDHEKILKDYFKWKKQKGTYWSTNE